MSSTEAVLAIDQGTTGTTAVLVDKECRIFAKSYRELTQIYPQPGWVEHDPVEIWQTVLDTIAEIRGQYQGKIRAVGITNQRETTIVWNKRTGAPVYNAIVWQCRRTTDVCDELKPHSQQFLEKTGLPVDAYFSVTKIQWILENIQGFDRDDLLFGTVDTWLIWKLTQGQVHATDFTNASRTLIFNILEKDWDRDLCRLLGIPLAILPEVKRSCDDYGEVAAVPGLEGLPILGVAGDQQAALFGQTGFAKGQIKNTYGTGCFLLLNTGEHPIFSQKGLLSTLAVNGAGDPCFALEGSIFVGGAAIQWLRDEMGLLENSTQSEECARAVTDNAGVYLVPAFVGLGAPHWIMEARGILTGLTRSANKNHVIRAALESMAYQTSDVLALMQAETGVEIQQLFVDGGAAANDFLMQFQADILDARVARPDVIESTSLGAAFLAGLKAGFWENNQELIESKSINRIFEPEMNPETRKQLLAGWQKALRQALTI